MSEEVGAIGFIGVGTINAACIRGLIASGLSAPIVLSPRGREVSDLVKSHPSHVTVAESNQAVIDAADLVFVAVSQKAEGALRDLEFSPKHTLVSLMAGVSHRRVAELAKLQQSQVVLAVPLPSVATRQGATLVAPRVAMVVSLFDRLGVAVALEDPALLTRMMCVTCVMGDFYARQRTIANWLVDEQGVERSAAEKYVGAIFVSIAVDSQKGSFDHHVKQQTPGGLNEMVVHQQSAMGVYDALQASLTSVLARLNGLPVAAGKPFGTELVKDKDSSPQVGLLVAGLAGFGLGAAVATVLGRQRGA